MEIELIEIKDFLKQHHPFDLLPEDGLLQVVQNIEIKYARRGTVLFMPNDENHYLWVVRTGAVETIDPEGHLLARLSEGECFGVRALLRGGIAVNKCEAIEDSLLYMLPAQIYDRLCKQYPQFAFFFAPMGGDRLRSAQAVKKEKAAEDLGLLASRVGDMIVRDPITISSDVTITQAAAKMAEEGVSCLLVVHGHELVGIVTDKDLRNRVVAKALDYNTPLVEVMTHHPKRIEADAYLFDALLAMSRHNIRHLPVVAEGSVRGVITTTNIVQKQATSMVYLVGDIYKRDRVEGLQAVARQLPTMMMNLVDTGASAHNVGHVVSTVSDAIATRLLQLAEKELGAAPIPYAWVVMGSQARHDQTALSDQDNGLILHDSYDEAEHGEYFWDLAKFVCDGLNECGYIYCPGDVMAMNDKWRQPLKAWKTYFARWIDEPDPKALMLSSIFFDMRCLYGDEDLHHELRDFVLSKAKGNRIFLSFMTGNALSHQPPLGFFKNFVLIRGGDHNDTFDMKHNGVVPIIDLARTYALDGAVEALNTQDRLKAAADLKIISQNGANDLLDALEFISITRLRHQASQIRQGGKPDNFMAPSAMSHFERNHLKDAFSVVKTMQSALSQSYAGGR